jgi:hypothetical protein
LPSSGSTGTPKLSIVTDHMLRLQMSPVSTSFTCLLQPFKTFSLSIAFETKRAMRNVVASNAESIGGYCWQRRRDRLLVAEFVDVAQRFATVETDSIRRNTCILFVLFLFCLCFVLILFCL